MCTRIGFIGLALLAAACIREPLFPGTPRKDLNPHAGPHRADSSGGIDTAPPGEHVYLTAVRFPDGYAWDLDTCAVEGTVWIDLYRDGIRVRSVPAGGSVHPDMHRFTGGHLYTDCSADSVTVVSRDGVELFRFRGREALRGFLVREDGIHTLGQDRDGAGFTYRIDGRVVYRSEAGAVLGRPDASGEPGGALTDGGEDVFYACCLPSERGKEYVVMRNEEVYRSFQESDGVRAFGLVGGRVCRVESNRRQLSLYVDDRESPLAIQGGEAFVWCRMAPWDGEILTLLCVTGALGRRTFLQASDGRTVRFPAGETVSDLVAEGKRAGWTVTDGRGDLLRVRWSDGTALEAPGGFLASGRCILLRNGRLYLATTGRDGAPNRYRLDDACTDIPFNGYFTSVTVE